MTKANECTCPSGNGSLRHPCPAHPAVEQAGGDERAAFEGMYSSLPGVSPKHDFCRLMSGDYKYAGPRFAWLGWQARAALAQPSPAEDMSAAQELAGVKAILNDMADALKRLTFHARTTGGTAGPDAALMNACERAERVLSLGGMGAAFMRGCDDHEANAEQAEEERPEMSSERAAYFMRRFRSEEKLLGPNEQAAVDYVLSLIAQHERIVGELRAENERLANDRDRANQFANGAALEINAALARVAELEKREPASVPMPDEIHQMAFEEGQPAEDGDGYLFSSEEFDLFVQRLLDACAAPVAQAQHSVPEGWKLVPSDDGCVTSSMKAECIGEFSFYIRAACAECLDVGTDSDCHVCGGDIEYDQKIDVPWDTCKEIYKAMLAAAPGKEGV